MNKSFKVVFSKARGALMAVNELTSSVQAKGTKTVIAVAVASLVAGGAMARRYGEAGCAPELERDRTRRPGSRRRSGLQYQRRCSHHHGYGPEDGR